MKSLHNWDLAMQIYNSSDSSSNENWAFSSWEGELIALPLLDDL